MFKQMASLETQEWLVLSSLKLYKKFSWNSIPLGFVVGRDEVISPPNIASLETFFFPPFPKPLFIKMEAEMGGGEGWLWPEQLR